MSVRAVEVVVFDVNETLSDLEPLRARLTEGGAPGQLLETWFAATLRDGFALTTVGSYASFRQVGTDVLHGLLTGVPGLGRAPRDLADHVLDGFSSLDVHPDVTQGLRLLHDAGLRLVTLTNGATSVSRALLERAGVSQLFERQLSVDDAGRWKPHPDAYRWVAEQCAAEPAAMSLIAVHPWDLHGAAAAGMSTGWLDRHRKPYPRAFTPPTLRATDLATLAGQLIAGTARS